MESGVGNDFRGIKSFGGRGGGVEASSRASGIAGSRGLAGVFVLKAALDRKSLAMLGVRERDDKFERSEVEEDLRDMASDDSRRVSGEGESSSSLQKY